MRFFQAYTDITGQGKKTQKVRYRSVEAIIFIVVTLHAQTTVFVMFVTSASAPYPKYSLRL